jgi:hypothetical protein
MRVSLYLGTDPTIEMSASGRLVDRLFEYRDQAIATA